MKAYDLVVVGGGSAGHAAAAMGTRLGLSCAVVEEAKILGGLCILRGCMPSKTLIESANRLRDIREASRFGIDAGAAVPDADAIRARVRTLVEDFRSGREEEMKDAGYDLLRGEADFLNERELAVTLGDNPQKVLTARAFIVATGSEPAIPDLPGLEDTPYWTSDDVVTLPQIPDRLIVLGGGAIGLECAHLFEGLGSAVTVVIRSGRVLKEFDPEISSAIETGSRERGIRILAETSVKKVDYLDGLFTVHFEGEKPPAQAEALLVATGRKPRTAGVTATGVEMTDGRIRIDRHAASSVPHLFAAGDCASPLPVVHLAVIQGETAARNIAWMLHGTGSQVSWEEESAMTALFTHPQAVKIGPDEETLRKRGYEPVSGRQDFADFGKGMIAGERHGLVKVTIDRATGLILAATGVGPSAAETAHLLQFAISRRLTVEEYIALPHYHPTLVEAWQRAAENAANAR